MEMRKSEQEWAESGKKRKRPGKSSTKTAPESRQEAFRRRFLPWRKSRAYITF
ncbi:UNVERIFIED_ORG: thyroliberin [Lacrimispora saccharolytica]